MNFSTVIFAAALVGLAWWGTGALLEQLALVLEMPYGLELVPAPDAAHAPE